MAQTRLGSAVEAVANVAIGYFVAIGAQLLIFPFFGVNLPLHENLLIGGIFTVVSLVRSYLLRRLFRRLHG
jgi:hypothetical protein